MEQTTKKFRVYGLLLAFCFAAIGSLSASNYYVSPNGSNANDGSIGAPWQTIGKAFETAGPGDTVFVRGGQYPSEDLFKKLKNGGTQEAYLVIKAFPGEEPVLNKFTHFGLDKQYTRIEGLTFVDQGIAGLGVGNQVVGNTFIGNGFNFAAIAAAGDDMLVEGNTINVTQGSTQDHGVYVQRGTGKIIRNNTFLGSTGYAIHVFDEQKKADSSQWIPFPLKDVLIEGNYISGSAQRDGIIVAKGRGGTTIDLRNITIRNNIITANGRSGMFLREGTNIKVYNNTIYKNTAASMGITFPVQNNEMINNVTVANNIIVTAEGNDHIMVTSTGENIVVDNNLYWPASGAITGTTDAHAIFAAPLLVNPDAGDFHITPTSPALDRGITIPSVTQDFEGSVRPQGDGYDIGADEFGDKTVPVKLASFEAAVFDNSVKLSWRTAIETNNFGFEVQRSSDNLSFQGIGFLAGSKNAGSGASYLFWDNNLSQGRYYYRLKQIDFSGAFEFSGTVQVTIVAPEQFELLQNYPNPFNPTTEIAFVVPDNSQVRLTVYNVLGQQVRTLLDREDVPAGRRTITWDGKNDSGQQVPSGIYFYRLEAGTVALSRRMVLLK
ncbi:MAG: right-handed parallel beta-helix repeat-containing protein [bacterium]